MMGFIEIYWVLLFSSRFYWVTRDRIEFDSYFFFSEKDISCCVRDLPGFSGVSFEGWGR